MFISEVVNLPTLNTPYRLLTLLSAILGPNCPATLPGGTVKAVTTNTGSVALGKATMASVDDGNRLEISEQAPIPAQTGVVLDLAASYVIGSANNQKVLIQGTTY